MSEVAFGDICCGQDIYFDGLKHRVNRKRILVEEKREESCIELGKTGSGWHIFNNKRFSHTLPAEKVSPELLFVGEAYRLEYSID